ncbi:TetR/AcrR family transcriptional regulator [Albirhodobacter sp. R86504]|uniref:TetR/AcrR family transcriptional regulator n=1 Tax=Albirhodobacter sp. R86504 TaxID=3093848 RepID=UPI00366C9C5E
MSNTRLHILDTGRRLTAQRGFTAVGLTELLTAAEVPKGSFYHYFSSKEDYGVALLEHYVNGYSAEIGTSLGNDTLTGRDQILRYFEAWHLRQGDGPADRKCLIVKLAAEISDLSPAMRAVLQGGVERIVARLGGALRKAQADGSVAGVSEPDALAVTLYQIWLGASLMAHLSQDAAPLAGALRQTRALLPVATLKPPTLDPPTTEPSDGFEAAVVTSL